MGGNCLKNTRTRRYLKDEFEVVSSKVLSVLKKDFPGCRINILPSYRNKEDFGDCDILFESDNLNLNIRTYLQNTFNPNEIVKNGSCYSFNVDELQIDLILTPTKDYETSWNYYRYSELGNFQGSVAHKFGFKYGHEGLVYVFRDNNYEFGQIIISRDSDQINRFLGYDPEVFNKGFDTLEEIFVFASSTPFFNKAIFDYENRNHTSRVRDRKRKNYHAFLEWMQVRENLPQYPWPSMLELGGRVSKEEHMQRAFEFFPKFKVEFDAMTYSFNLWKRAKELFNGDVVRNITGLDNQELGMFMKHIKTKVPEREELVKMTPEQIEVFVRAEYMEYSK